MNDNQQLTQFLAVTRAAGFDLRLNWEVKRWPRDKGSVRHYTVTDGPNGKPAMRTLVIVDYGPGEGYSLYGEAQSSKIADDVMAVTGLDSAEIIRLTGDAK